MDTKDVIAYISGYVGCEPGLSCNNDERLETAKSEIATLTAERDRLLEIAKEVADMTTRETEYAGRMESYCAGCDAYIGDDDFGDVEHDESCLIMLARAALSREGE